MHGHVDPFGSQAASHDRCGYHAHIKKQQHLIAAEIRMPLSQHRITTSLVTSESEYPIEPLLDAHGRPLRVRDRAYFDLVVIGSGPAALTFVTRWLEERPAALYLEDERQHLHWLKRQTHAAPVLETRKPTKSSDRIIKTNQKNEWHMRKSSLRVLIVDKLGDGWLGQWHRNFGSYEIPFLRSPMFFHPDPSDLDGLLEYAVQTERASTGPYTYVCDMLTGRQSQSKSRSRSAKKGALQRPDLLEVPGVVGREVSKHKWKQSKHRRQAQMFSALGPVVNERDRRDYQNPSTPLFRDFTNHLVDRYHLHPQKGKDGKVRPLSEWLASDDEHQMPAMLLRAEVIDMDYGRLEKERADGSLDEEEGFSLHMADGSCIGAKYVVSAIGYGGRPSVPTWLATASKKSPTAKRDFVDRVTEADSDNASNASSSTEPSTAESEGEESDKYEHPPPNSMGDGWAHSSAIAAPSYSVPPPHIAARIASGRPTTAIVIGGGLTSAQLTDQCVRRGFSRVILVMRGFFKVKPFDFSVDWVGKYANAQKMQFWQSDDAKDRMNMINEGRDGGSINPVYAKVLLQHAQDGRVELRTHTEIEDAEWDAQTQKWSLKLHRKDHARADSQYMNNAQQPGTSVPVIADYIVSSTGSDVSFRKLPFMHTLAEKMQIPEVSGVPIVNEDLQYGSIPLYCIGAYSAVQIGPTAFNLGGIREGADRVAAHIRDKTEEHDEATLRTTADSDEPSLGHFAHFLYHHLQLDAAD